MVSRIAITTDHYCMVLVLVTTIILVGTMAKSVQTEYCDGGIICLPDTYDKFVPPPLESNGMDVWLESGQLGIKIPTLTHVDDFNFMLTLDLELSMSWLDDRISWNDTELQSLGGHFLNEETLTKIWKPRLYLDQSESDKFIMGDPQAAWTLRENSTVIVTIWKSLVLRMFCNNMDFLAYPMDTQVCNFGLFAFGEGNGQILRHLFWISDVKNEIIARNIDYMATLEFRNQSSKDEDDEDDTEDDIIFAEFVITMKRKYVRHVYEIIAPTGMLVATSWVISFFNSRPFNLSQLIIIMLSMAIKMFLLQLSFLIPPDKIPGRMALLITLSLCMFNTLNSVARRVPLTGKNPTALVRWIIGCLTFVILAMVEFGCQLHMAYGCRSLQVGLNNTPMNRTNPWDKLMIIIFPASFIFYAVIFWTIAYDSQSFLSY